MKHKLMIILMGLVMAIVVSFPLEAKSFEGKEAQMNRKCAVIKDKETQRECIAYKQYLDRKNQNLNKEITSIKKELHNIKGNMSELAEKIKKSNDEVARLDEQIVDVENTIVELEDSIRLLNVEIKEREKDILQRDEMMQERLIEMQPYTGSNNFLDFLMGADSFSDLLRRSEIVKELSTYEADQIEHLQAEKKQLASDKEIVDDQKALMVAQEKELENQREKAMALKSVNDALMSAYRTKEEELLDEQIKAQLAQADIPKIDTSLAEDLDKPHKPGGGNRPNGGGGNITPSHDFVTPIRGNWYRSAGTWAYPSGNVHRGMDFATYNQQGLKVVAPASGIVIWTYQGCASPSGNNYPNSCGIPRTTGNNLTMLTRVNGYVYAFSFYHLSGFAVGSQTKVQQGQVIAYTGNSGNSTGPHCHVEMIRVGKMTLEAAIAQFNRTGDLSFGVGWHQDPRPCSRYGSPCRLRPEDYFL